jgi:DNA-binding MarR family transcriptional regulator
MSEQHYHASTYTAQNSIGYLIKRAHSMMMDVLENLFTERGFSFIHYAILTWVRDGIAVNPKDICVQYRHDSGALTRVIDQLEERGLLERVRRGNDRRKVELQLTEEGRKTVESLIPLVVDKLNLALVDFSRAEVAEFKRLLVKLNTRLTTTLDPKASIEAKALADALTEAHLKPAVGTEA